jgi:heme/copper-type cytochrome/quinol oxidase subunit 1
MPRPSIWFIRASLVYLVLGFTWGALMLFHKGIPLHPLVWRLFPSHIELVLFGWTVQLVIGVAYWILPRYPQPPKRGRPGPVWFAFWSLNLGICLTLVGLFSPGAAWIGPASSLAKFGSILAFAVHAWPRFKGF